MEKPIAERRSVADDPLVSVSVEGASMFPVLLSRDKVLVKKSTIEDLLPGDIVVWADETGAYVAHRVLSTDVSASPPRVTTKGDLCPQADYPVEMDQVLGKVVAVMRDGAVQWINELDQDNTTVSGNGAGPHQASDPVLLPAPKQKPVYRKMRVLDLRSISPASIRDIGAVEDIGLVLLSPENAHAWAGVRVHNTRVLTVPDDYRVYTGQPELIPELLDFLQTPLRLVVVGQLFLTAFDASQIPKAIGHLILEGQALVSSAEARSALEPLTEFLSGRIEIVPREHIRWIGSSLLGPEYLRSQPHQPLVVLGRLTVSHRFADGPDPDEISLFHVGHGS